MYRLLIVDDEPLMRTYIRNNVTTIHPEWECAGEAEDGQEALDALDALGSGEKYDLILTDIKMPVMDGLELARQVAQRDAPERMIILSGYDEFALAKEAIRFGVDDYLLKPVVKEELHAALERMARKLDADKANRLYQMSLYALSEASKEQLARQFLSALAADNDAETKALYPILFRLKISLIEAEAAILLLELDEGELLLRSEALSDETLFRYILHQTATELAGSANRGFIVFFDHEQRTAVLVRGEDAADVRTRTEQLYSDLAAAIANMTGISLWGAIGSCELDALQLAASSRHARQSLQQRLFLPRPCLMFAEQEDMDRARIKQFERDLVDVHTAIMSDQDDGLYMALKELVQHSGIAGVSTSTVASFGAHVLKRLSALAVNSGSYAAGECWRTLRTGISTLDSCSVEDVVLLYRRMLQQLRPQLESTDAQAEEHEIVARAKRYIGEHYAEPLSLALVAETTGVSPGYLSSLFHQSANESYIKYVTRIRMENAAALLRSKPPEKVYDVAEKVGYVSVKHFSYVFKQFFGIPPGEYQEKVLE